MEQLLKIVERELGKHGKRNMDMFRAYVFGERKMADIAQEHDVTESMVSHIIKRVKEKIAEHYRGS